MSEWQDNAWRRDYISLGGRLVAAVAGGAVTPPPSPPTVSTQPQSQATAPHRLVTFTATANGYPAPTVQWQVWNGTDWENIAGATSANYALVPSRVDNGRRVRAVFTNSSGTATTNEARLAVSDQDFDGDGKTDVAVFRPSDGTWHVKYSGGSELHVQFGADGDLPVAADYNGDGLPDLAVFRPSTATWYVRHSGLTTTYATVQWGGYGDVPVPGDYDGDDRADMAVFRPSVGHWYVLPSSGSGVTDTPWGTTGDIPVPGDYDGDGKTDVGVYRPTEARWYILLSSAPSAGLVVQWGAQGDIPVPADFDADGQTDITVFRPVDTVLNGGGWYFSYSTGAGTTNATWGGYGDVPVPADYNGDAFADVAVYRPSDATWYFQWGSTQWGTYGDQPVPARLPSWKSPMYW